MGYMHLNGIDIPIESCDPGVVEVNAANGWSPNGVHQHQRAGTVRQWKCRSGLLSSDMRPALIEMLMRRGDGWRFPFSVNDTGLLDGSNTAAFRSDMRRRGFPAAGSPTDPVAIVDTGVSGGRDLVHDAVPWAGAGGALWVEKSHTNLLTGNDANPEATGHLLNVGAPTSQGVNSTASFLVGSGSPWFMASGSGYTGKATTGVAVSAATRYVAVVGLYHYGAGRTVRIEVKESGAGAGATPIDFSTDDWPQGTWRRCVVAHTTTGTPGNLSIEITTNAAHQYAYDGLMLYAKPANEGDLIPWIDAGVTSTAADLRYPNPFTDSFRNGFCLSFWMRRNVSVSGDFRYVLFAGSSSPSPFSYVNIHSSFSNKLTCQVRSRIDSYSNMELTAGTDMPLTWSHHLVGYNPSIPQLDLWVNGVNDGSTTTLSGSSPPVVNYDDGDMRIGHSDGLPGPIAALQILPFPGSLELAAALYNDGNGASPGPQSVLPMTLTGDIFNDIGGNHALVTGQVDSTPNDRFWKGNNFQFTGGRVAFTLTEVTAI